MEKLKEMFTTHGTPRRLESDNGPPFNSKEFTESPSERDFDITVTPEYARANGEAESSLKLLNKTEQMAHLQKQNRNITIGEMLTGYHSTPHPATNTIPYEALMNRPERTKLDTQPGRLTQSVKDRAIDERDKQGEAETECSKQEHKTTQPRCWRLHTS